MHTVDELRAISRTYRIFTVPQAIDHLQSGGMLTLAPLCGGLPPDIAWPYLERVANDVVPELAKTKIPQTQGVQE